MWSRAPRGSRHRTSAGPDSRLSSAFQRFGPLGRSSLTAPQRGRVLLRVITAVALVVPAASATAQAPPPLTFFGFTAGDSLAVVARQLKASGGSALTCKRSRRDASVSECRGHTANRVTGHRINLWLAAIDSASGVLTLSGPADGEALASWRDTLVAHYGPVPVRVQGTQSMMQWVRRGRMLRLTWRRERGTTIVSVSLVDGHVLDAWGARRQRPPPS